MMAIKAYVRRTMGIGSGERGDEALRAPVEEP